MKILLDTCCIIWAVSAPSALSETAANYLTYADAEIYVSPITVRLKSPVHRSAGVLHWIGIGNCGSAIIWNRTDGRWNPSVWKLLRKHTLCRKVFMLIRQTELLLRQQG